MTKLDICARLSDILRDEVGHGGVVAVGRLTARLRVLADDLADDLRRDAGIRPIREVNPANIFGGGQ